MSAFSFSACTRKMLTGAAAAATLALGIAGTTTPAAAWHHHHRGWGGPVAAGVIGGLALGALAASARPVASSDCWVERRRVYNERGRFLGHRRIQVCD